MSYTFVSPIFLRGFQTITEGAKFSAAIEPANFPVALGNRRGLKPTRDPVNALLRKDSFEGSKRYKKTKFFLVNIIQAYIRSV